MLKQRREAVAKVAADFLKTEAAIDEAARNAAACMATMLQQRAEANLPLGTGLKAIQLVSEVSALLVKARELAIALHVELAQIPDSIGIRNFGDTSECPPMAAGKEADAPNHLRIVA